MEELDDLAEAVRVFSDILDEADAIAVIHGYTHGSTNPMKEIASRLPLMLASLSPDARNLIREHMDITGIVAEALTEVMPSIPKLRLVSPA